jgi:hypothetical protein
MKAWVPGRLAVLLAVVALPASVHAQTIAAQMPGLAMQTAAPLDNTSDEGPAPPEAKGSVKLFDQRTATFSLQLDVGPIWYRPTSDVDTADWSADYQRGTGEIAAGPVISTPAHPFYLAGVQKTLLRMLDSKSFAWSVLTHELATGAALGPIEPEVRLGFSLLTVDAMYGDWSFELLSPRVALGMGIHLGKIRVDMKGYTEYLWRWFGPDVLVRGITLGLRFDVVRPESRFVEATR